MAEQVEESTRADKIDDMEKAVESAFSTGKADRAKITQAAQLDAAEAVALAGVAMESDEAAAEAMRISTIAAHGSDRKNAKAARAAEREARKKANADHRAATQAAKRAYDAIKFSAPNKLGFVRVVQVLFALHIFSTVIYLMITSRNNMVYTAATAMDWIMVVLEGVAFWMFLNRYKVGRPYTIAMGVAGLVLTAAVDVSLGKFNIYTLLINGAFYIFLILYFTFSRRVKATLVNDIRLGTGEYEKDGFVIERRGWPFVRNLIIYFLVFSNLGHFMEMAMCQLIIAGVVEGDYDPSNTMLWRDWLFPFAMEGVAVVCIALFLYPLFEWFRKKFTNRFAPYVASFAANALFCSIVEFAGGLMVNADHQLWDYSDQFMNIMGQVCLQNTLAFGVAASLITWFVYPMLERWIARVPYDIMNIVFVVVFVFGLIIWSLYIIPGYEDMDPVVQQPAAEAFGDREELNLRVIGELYDAAVIRDKVNASDVFDDAERKEILAQLDTIRDAYNVISDIALPDDASASAASASASAESPDKASSDAS